MLTIFTPTYNRCEKLHLLYDSLEKQTCKSFEWLIVDDGSTDDTKEFIDRISHKATFNIRYMFQNNQGKYIALNAGIENAKGNFFMCVDSDDTIPENSVSIVCKEMESLPLANIGKIFRMNLKNSNQSNKWDRIDNREIDAMDMRDIFRIPECVLVTRSEIVKKYRFPIIYNAEGLKEKYCPEIVLHAQFIEDGKYIARNKEIYNAEYQSDGLTINLFKKTWINNPYGALAGLKTRYFAAKKYNLVNRVWLRTKCILNINALCMMKHYNIYKFSPSSVYSTILLLPSIVFSYFRFR